MLQLRASAKSRIAFVSDAVIWSRKTALCIAASVQETSVSPARMLLMVLPRGKVRLGIRPPPRPASSLVAQKATLTVRTLS